jgi:hypothetical protein
VRRDEEEKSDGKADSKSALHLNIVKLLLLLMLPALLPAVSVLAVDQDLLGLLLLLLLPLCTLRAVLAVVK